MLTLGQVAADAVARCKAYKEKNSVQAACEAKIFYNDTYPKMKAEVAPCVLYSPTIKGEPGAVVWGQAYVTKGDCVWIVAHDGETPPPPENNALGIIYYVTMVTTSEGLRVAVDWGYTSSMPSDARLYIRDCFPPIPSEKLTWTRPMP
jgi:hypothetical protein